MLVVEQNARLALEFCDYAYVLESGRVVLEGPAAQLREDPQIQELYLGGAAARRERSFADRQALPSPAEVARHERCDQTSKA